ncbi:Alb1-domain-containing protein [Cercophora newfieldiana]|uniref:Alb1-domain-containing protein n=1 Tax=Cercophora newfieldiana TaxID=92897 RepID=A0AA39YG06_9PEZI|nr:Alb1-domain-containing protein [Cercophora newfieldiana]
MAKGTISKGKKGPSLHSRAARRATSPGIDTDKSLKNVQLPTFDSRPCVLSVHHSAGVSKKKRKVVMSSKARKRHEKSMDRAEAVMDRTETKVQKSKGHFKVIQTRNRAWDEINRDLSGVELLPKKKASKDPSGDAAVAAFFADGDAEMEEAAAAPATVPSTAAVVNDDDEIL